MAVRSSSTSPRAAATRGTSNSTAWRASSSTFPPADRAVMVKRPGWADTTSRAWVPIEPVEPSTATERGVTGPLSRLDDRVVNPARSGGEDALLDEPLVDDLGLGVEAPVLEVLLHLELDLALA